MTNNMLTKTITFDMDETLNEFYSIPGWLEKLHNEDSSPYAVAAPKYDSDVLNPLLKALQADGWKIEIVTWLAKGGSAEYGEEVAKVKKDWLAKHNIPYDEFFAVEYGTPKHMVNPKGGAFQILFDDNADIRKDWSLGPAFDANENIIPILAGLLEMGGNTRMMERA